MNYYCPSIQRMNIAYTCLMYNKNSEFVECSNKMDWWSGTIHIELYFVNSNYSFVFENWFIVYFIYFVSSYLCYDLIRKRFIENFILKFIQKTWMMMMTYAMTMILTKNETFKQFHHSWERIFRKCFFILNHFSWKFVVSYLFSRGKKTCLKVFIGYDGFCTLEG